MGPTYRYFSMLDGQGRCCESVLTYIASHPASTDKTVTSFCRFVLRLRLPWANVPVGSHQVDRRGFTVDCRRVGNKPTFKLPCMSLLNCYDKSTTVSNMVLYPRR